MIPSENNDIKIAKHFSLTEFECPCCGVVRLHKSLLNYIVMLRQILNKPIYINSAYRCIKHNAAVGGVENSYHLYGAAADIRIEGFTMSQFLLAAHTINIYKIIPYEDRNFVHININLPEIYRK